MLKKSERLEKKIYKWCYLHGQGFGDHIDLYAEQKFRELRNLINKYLEARWDEMVEIEMSKIPKPKKEIEQ